MDSDNGLSPGLHQVIIWTNAGILFMGPLGSNFSGILTQTHVFSFQNMHMKMLSVKWQLFCLSLNVLYIHVLFISHNVGALGAPSTNIV